MYTHTRIIVSRFREINEPETIEARDHELPILKRFDSNMQMLLGSFIFLYIYIFHLDYVGAILD